MKRWIPHAVVFVTSMCIMIVELVASRLVSKYLGSSLFTWTGVIGIVLGGISLGNWLGGLLADRFPPRRLAPVLLFASSLLTFLIIVLDILVGRLTWSLGTDGMTASALARTIALIAVLFLLPSCALGTVSPSMAKYALELAPGVGRTVGGIYAFGSLGSIAGTFLAGFLLIPMLGLTANILLVGIVLAVLSAAVGGRRLLSGLWAVVLVALALTDAPGAVSRSFAEGAPGGRRIALEKDSPYSYIRVTDEPGAAGSERTLRLDALIHNKRDTAHPDALLYEYERIFEALTREHFIRAHGARAAGFSTLTLGGGGFTLPTYLERHYPSARHTVVEIDPDVVRTARLWFGLPQKTGLRIVVSDARAFVRSRPDPEARSYDIVYCDAFNAFSVPSHLTTREFTAAISELLAPGGLYLVNCIDIFDSGLFLDSFLDTVKAVFPMVTVYVDPSFSPSARATFVVAAGGRTAMPDILRGPEGDPVGAALSALRIAELHARVRGQVLTDDHAPVDSLMAPVFLRSVR
jgi:spermidine synthase